MRTANEWTVATPQTRRTLPRTIDTARGEHLVAYQGSNDGRMTLVTRVDGQRWVRCELWQDGKFLTFGAFATPVAALLWAHDWRAR